MAREYANKFYRTKEWKNCRNAYFNSQNGICELCGKPGREVHHKKFLTPQNINDPDITLNWDNLQLLCSDCHCAIHNKAYEMHRGKVRRNTGIKNGYTFDENGDLVENKNVFIVWGAPASGKTKYVKEHKSKYDIVIDLDCIVSAISLKPDKTDIKDFLPFAFDVRDLLYKLIEERKYFFENAWIIQGLPKKEDRIKIQRRLKAQLIHIDTDKEKCIEQARNDDRRKNKEFQFKIIEKYFKELEL